MSPLENSREAGLLLDQPFCYVIGSTLAGELPIEMFYGKLRFDHVFIQGVQSAMRKSLAVLLISIIIAAVHACTTAIQAAIPANQAQAVITSPTMNAIVRGNVIITGSATHSNFWKYEVYFAPEPNPENRWVLIGLHENQVVDGHLETWNTQNIPDGSYSLLLRVVDKTGNYQEYYVRQISVANAVPTDTPLPTLTATATHTPLPAATPTFIIPGTPLALPSPTPTLARPPIGDLSALFDVRVWQNALCMGAQIMIAVVIVVGILFALRRFM